MPVVVGHRGAALKAPENTLASFRRALDDGAQILECDVHLSADGEIVVMHDETIDRTVARESPYMGGVLSEMTRAQLDEVLLDDGERVPSLQQFLDLLESRAADGVTPGAYIEIKAPLAGLAVSQAIADKPWAEVISFRPEALAAVREASPSTRLAIVSWYLTAEAVASARALDCEMVSLNIDRLDRADAELVHDLGKVLNVWSVNTDEQLDKALEFGADTISSDDPAKVVARLGADALV